MRIAMPCQGCLEGVSNEERNATPLHAMPKTAGELLEGGIVETECARGHRTRYSILLPQFEIVFELAALSLVEGNYPHAVQWFTTALERFFEFYACEVMRRRGIAGAEYEAARKGFRLAERQLGAFLVCYLLQTGTAFDQRTLEKAASLRNPVTHEGRIPRREEALEHGRFILSEIHRMLADLFPRGPDGEPRSDSQSDYFRATMTAIERAPAPTGPNVNVLGLMPTMVNFGGPSTWGEGTFERRLEILKRQRRDFYLPAEDT